MLTEAVGTHWHALVRDVIALGKDPDDMFVTKGLSLAKMVSIVCASPPSSSLRWYFDQGWSRTDHLIANMNEERAGVSHISQAYQRPGIEDRAPGSKFFPADAMTWEEMDRRDAQRATAARPATAGGKTRGRVWSQGSWKET